MFDEDAIAPGFRSVVEEKLRALLDSFEVEASSAPAEQAREPRRRPVFEVLPEARHAQGNLLAEARVPRFAALLESGVAALGRAAAAERAISAAAAERARALAEFARARPAAAFDRAPGEVGAASEASRQSRPEALTDVSEWAVDEVSVSLRMSSAAATALLNDSVLLVERLPDTLTALEQGHIGWPHARVIAEVLAPMSDVKRPEAEARVLERVEGKTPTQVRAAAKRALLRADAAAAAERLALAVREREVRAFAGDDGMGTLHAVLPIPVVRACEDALERYAEACAVRGDTRTKAQRMADCLADLILRPGTNGLPPVQAQLTVVASTETLLGGDEPGEVDGDLVPAPMVRELAYALGLLPRPAFPSAPPPVVTDQGPPPGMAAEGPSAVEGESSPAQVRALGALLGIRKLAGTALVHRPRIALSDELTGCLVALTDAVEMRRGGALGPPPQTPGYRPREELDQFVRLRDRRCRFPGCRVRPRTCDLDHTCPYPWGPTGHDNLCCLCEHHHRLSHQAPGWSLRATAGRGLEWTTPSGETITTYPPRFGADDDHPLAVATGASDDDPPPF